MRSRLPLAGFANSNRFRPCVFALVILRRLACAGGSMSVPSGDAADRVRPPSALVATVREFSARAGCLIVLTVTQPTDRAPTRLSRVRVVALVPCRLVRPLPYP